jgi:hypothetical protein
MGLSYLSLDQTTRELMVEEFKSDIKSDSCYTSTRFHQVGKDCYFQIMPGHLEKGSDDSLAQDLKANDCFNMHETDKNGKQKKVPVTAPQTFAEGEFNRFYMRALSVRSISEDFSIEVYRARYSENPSPESEAMIGKILNSEVLLRDLRDCKGIETTLGLPRPNSGLSIKVAQ